MSSPVDDVRSAPAVALPESIPREHARRIGRAWVELRRGAWTQGFRTYIFGGADAQEQGRMDALDLLARRERTMTGLAERLRVDPSTATRSASRLVAEGLAERGRSADDGRIVVVRITPAGRARHAEIDARRAHAMSLILDKFTAEECADLAVLLERLVASVDDVGERLSSRR